MRTALAFTLMLFGLVGTVRAAESDFEPMQMEDGSRTWRLTVKGMGPAPREEWIAEQIRIWLGRSGFCPQGWEAGEYKKSLGNLIVEGRCK